MSKTIRSPAQSALCEAIKRCRVDAKLSQQALAVRLHCHQSLIARIESGERRIDVVELVILAKALGVVPAALLEGVESRIGEPLSL